MQHGQREGERDVGGFCVSVAEHTACWWVTGAPHSQTANGLLVGEVEGDYLMQICQHSEASSWYPANDQVLSQ